MILKVSMDQEPIYDRQKYTSDNPDLTSIWFATKSSLVQYAFIYKENLERKKKQQPEYNTFQEDFYETNYKQSLS